MKKKILFCILSHKNPKQIKRLVNRLLGGSDNSYVLIYHDSNSFRLTRKMIDATTPRVKIFNNQINARWGSWELNNAVLESFKIAIQEFEFDWFYLLSGQDYPLTSITSIEKELSETDRDAFIETYGINDTDAPSVWNMEEGYIRYYYRHIYIPRFKYYYKLPSYLLKCIELLRNWLNKNQKFIQIIWLPRGLGYSIAVKRSKIPFNHMMKCYWGSQWFVISQKCVKYIIEFIEQSAEFVNFYKSTFIPDESMIQTIIKNNKELLTDNDNKRFLIFKSDNEPSPEVLKMEHFHEIAHSEKHFARKFDYKIDDEILNLIDNVNENRAHYSNR